MTQRTGRREWVGLAVIALPCVLYSMDLTVLNLAVPQLSAALKPSSTQLLWIIDIYGFVLAGFLITMGTLGDRIGRRRLLLIGAAAFGVASVVAAFSKSAGMLIGTRAVLGIAGATLAPSTLSLIRNMFLDPKQRSFAIGVWITSYSAGGAIGPLVGGALLEHFWWGSVFLVGVPVMVLLLLVGPVLLPESRDPQTHRPDVLSAMLSLAAVLSVIWGLKEIAQSGPGWLPAFSIVAGLFLGVVFVSRQGSLADPLIDLRLFQVPAFSASLATYTFATFVAFGAYLFTSQYLQLVLGLSPFRSGLWMLPFFIGFIVGSMLCPVIARRVRPGVVMSAGLVVAAIGYGMLARVDGTSGYAILVAFFVFSLGLAPAFTLTTDLIVGSAPPERAGAASALSETGSEFGGALGIAILGSIGTAVYRRQVTSTLPPGIPADVAEAARSTLGGAVAAAGQLPERLGAAVVDAAREAFTHGMRVSAMISMVGAIGLAVFTAVVLRGAKAGGASR